MTVYDFVIADDPAESKGRGDGSGAAVKPASSKELACIGRAQGGHICDMKLLVGSSISMKGKKERKDTTAAKHRNQARTPKQSR